MFFSKRSVSPKIYALLPKRFDGTLSIPKRQIKKEAYLGGRIFGNLQQHQQREFFCLDPKTWIWHESWQDKETKKQQAFMLRYDIKSDQIYKRKDNDDCPHLLDQQESRNLQTAIAVYRTEVLAKLYPNQKFF